jgi:hypothetical protein
MHGFSTSRLITTVGVVLVLLFVIPLAIQFVVGTDYASSPISLDDSTDGALVVINPDDELEVVLFGHPRHVDTGWAIASIDERVVEIVGVTHVPDAGGPPMPDLLADVPAAVRELWTDLPERTDPPDGVWDDGSPMWYWPMTHFTMIGAEVGIAEVHLELRAEDRLVHSYAFTVSVIDGDPCDHVTDPSVEVPHRCE